MAVLSSLSYLLQYSPIDRGVFHTMRTPSIQLPYTYDTDSEAETLPNGILRAEAWRYRLERVQMDVIEHLKREICYTLADYSATYSLTYEWRYRVNDNTPNTFEAQGFRQYQEGELLKAGAPYLHPEVAIMLCFTPQLSVLPSFIESVPQEVALLLLEEAQVSFQDHNPLNAWLSPPIDAPKDAPTDVSGMMSTLRRETGLITTRGRGRMLSQVMRATGVIVDENGWALTPEELKRRRALAKPANV